MPDLLCAYNKSVCPDFIPILKFIILKHIDYIEAEIKTQGFLFIRLDIKKTYKNTK